MNEKYKNLLGKFFELEMAEDRVFLTISETSWGFEAEVATPRGGLSSELESFELEAITEDADSDKEYLELVCDYLCSSIHDGYKGDYSTFVGKASKLPRLWDIQKFDEDEYLVVQGKLMKALKGMGFIMHRPDHSGFSSSAYVTFGLEPTLEDERLSNDTCWDAEDSKGNLLFDSWTIRISDHDLPSRYDLPDYDIDLEGNHRQQHNTHDWKDALKWAQKKLDAVDIWRKGL